MVDLINIKGDSVWQNIFYFLKEVEGYDVYPPGIHQGEVSSNYVVLTKGSSTRHMSGISTAEDLYKVICYVPANQYDKLDGFILDVEKSMEKLNPLVLPTNDKTPSFYDDLNKSHNVAITYKNYKKML